MSTSSMQVYFLSTGSTAMQCMGAADFVTVLPQAVKVQGVERRGQEEPSGCLGEKEAVDSKNSPPVKSGCPDKDNPLT